MGDRKPKKTSSGNSEAHKAKQTKDQADRPLLSPRDEKSKNNKK